MKPTTICSTYFIWNIFKKQKQKIFQPLGKCLQSRNTQSDLNLIYTKEILKTALHIKAMTCNIKNFTQNHLAYLIIVGKKEKKAHNMLLTKEKGFIPRLHSI